MRYWNPERTLLCSVSTLALLAVIGGTRKADAAEQAHNVWSLELQGQYLFDETADSQSFTPSAGIPDPSIHPRNGFEGGGKVTFRPAGSPLSYALGVRYGRSKQASRSFSTSYPSGGGTFDQTVDTSERLSHTTVDFEVGKDVGIGLFGSGTTTIGGGLRYAHFDSTTRGNFATSFKYGGFPASRAGQFELSRRSDVVGPRVFARTTSPFAGELGERGVSLGLNVGAGVLFGRQSAKNDVFLSSGTPGQFAQFSRSRQVTVPTVDASAQVNWAVPGSPFVVSAGYRYDGSYNVMDGGSAGSSHQIDSVQHGPFLALVWTLD
jgi:hypothetical protein